MTQMVNDIEQKKMVEAMIWYKVVRLLRIVVIKLHTRLKENELSTSLYRVLLKVAHIYSLKRASYYRSSTWVSYKPVSCIKRNEKIP